MADRIINVLLIEDNRGDARLLGETLADGRGAQFELLHADRLSLGFEQLDKGNIDVVLLDLGLPDSQGFDTLTAVQKYAPDVPVVVLTGFDDDDFAMRAVREGAQDYLVKGFVEPELLTRSIRYAIERKQAADDLQKAEMRFRSVAQTAPDAILSIDHKGTVLFWNGGAENIFGYAEDEMLGESLTILMPEEIRERFAKRILHFDSEGGMNLLDRLIEWNGLRKNGEEFPVEVSWGIWEVDGEKFYSCIARDISERKRLEEEAVNARLLQTKLEKEKEIIELKDRFLSMMSHEIRVPLAIIQTSGDLLTHYFDRISEERRKELIQQVLDQIGQVTGLIDDMLLTSRIQSGKMKPYLEWLDLVWICRETLEQTKLIDNDVHRFELDCNAPDHHVMLDRKMLSHILNNFLSNAVKYSHDGGEVRLYLGHNSENVIFRVSDDGIGIPERDISKLFEPFHRAQNARDIKGTGLGLAIAKHYAELQGGSIQIESQENVGTTITAYLPLKPPTIT